MRKERTVIVFKTAFGWTGAAVSDQGLCAIVLPKKNKKAVERELRGSESGVRSSGQNKSMCRSILGRATKLLRRYFLGERVSFDLPLDMRYHTAFQQAVWHATAGIPFGETRSYGWVAKKIKNPKAVRAVGQALGANPIPIIIP